jgi:hypothetical protein
VRFSTQTSTARDGCAEVSVKQKNETSALQSGAGFLFFEPLIFGTLIS